jgi:hypothetical protein
MREVMESNAAQFQSELMRDLEIVSTQAETPVTEVIKCSEAVEKFLLERRARQP